MRIQFWIACLGACASVGANAQEDDTLAEVIVVANRPTSVGKLDVPLKDLPQNVSVITRDTLDTFGNPRIEDISYSTVGIQAVAPAQGVTNYGFFVRGFNGAPAIVDGYYSSVNAFGSVGIHDMAVYESVEVLRGPASLLYGQGNPGGVVNLTLKRPLDSFGAQVASFFDSHGARRIDADITGPLSAQANARMVAVYEDSESFRDFVTRDRVLLAPSLGVSLSDNVDLKLNYIYDDLKYMPDNGPAWNEDLIAHLPVDRNLGEPWLQRIHTINRTARAELDWRFAEGWTARVGYFAHTSRLPDGSREIDPDATLGGTLVARTYTTTSAEKNGAEDSMLTGQLLGKFTTGALDHTFTAAIDYIDNRTKYDYEVNDFAPIDYANPQYLSGPIALTPFFSGEGAFQSYFKAIYAQDLIALGEHWKFLLGARKDELATTGYADAAGTIFIQKSDESAVTPRAGVVYRANEDLTLYASYSEAFVPLIGLDRFNRPFDPEESRSYELGTRLQLGDQLLLTAAVFNIEKRNIIVVDPADVNFNINAGVARSNGAELEIGGRITPAWRVSGGLAYTDAKIVESVDPLSFPEGDRLPAAAKWSALLSSRYDFDGFVPGFSIGGNVSYASRRPFVVPNVEQELEAYTRVDLFAAYRLADRLEMQLNVNNATDERILLANGYGRVQFDSARTWSMTLRYELGELAK